QIAREAGLPALVEGSNFSDNNDHRPGMKAALEMGVYSPLREAGLIKGEIRLLSRKLEIPVWDKPSDTCLCTRIPYGEQINIEKIGRVNLAEKILADMGFSSIRVRGYNLVAGIEVDPEQVEKLMSGAVRDKVVRKLKNIGFEKVCVNLEGYRSGRLYDTAT
ncbi:MAG TPA: TIGR00268 family protein, partial [Clostridia bacterium]|nr:TIGR00268 family protein [Clostridia bacterium]